jgi:membrane protein implicated in regulation of membrane protease activity
MHDARPQPVPLTGSRTRASRPRRAAHVAVGLASWVALTALWVWQLGTFVPASWFAGVATILVLLAVWSAFSVVWVAWSRNIYRRRHRRTEPVVHDVDFTQDALGRRIVAPPQLVGAHGGHVLVTVGDDGVKRYQPALARTPEPAPRVRSAGRRLARRHGGSHIA